MDLPCFQAIPKRGAETTGLYNTTAIMADHPKAKPVTHRDWLVVYQGFALCF
jgi:hypothetical protein